MYVQAIYIGMVPDLGWFSSTQAMIRVRQSSFEDGSLPLETLTKVREYIYIYILYIYIRIYALE